jgi:HK97 family phage portal protein
MPRRDASEAIRGMSASGTLFAIVDGLATGTSQADWHLYRKPTRPGGERVEVFAHPALTLLSRPNRFQTRDDMIEAGQQYLDLVGELWVVIGRSAKSPMPLEMWVIRPDRMAPVPDAERFISAYRYTTPDGQEVSLEVDEVLFRRRPDPEDPYRGIGPVKPILSSIHGEQYAAEWNLNFFRNGAEPGGIIEVPRSLSDNEFDRLASRWRAQHQGVANAHRVAILEEAKWINRGVSQRDMQFVESSAVTEEKIRRAYRFPKPMLGDTQDSNRAVAQAAEYVFARWLVAPRLEGWRSLLNNQLLPLFGSLGEGYEFDFDSPVPEDGEAVIADRDSRVAAAKTLYDVGADPAAVLDWLDIPVPIAPKPAPPISAPAVVGPPPDTAGAALAASVAALVETIRTGHARQARSGHGGHRHTHGDDGDEPWRAVDKDMPELPEPPDGVNPVLPAGAGPDLTPVQETWLEALDALLEEWTGFVDEWRKAIVRQVWAAVAAADRLALLGITVNSDDASAALEAAMTDLFATAAEQVVTEAAEQDVSVEAADADGLVLAAVAQVVAHTLAKILIGSATTEAIRGWSPGEPDAVASLVDEHLASLTDAAPRAYLGSALTSAQHSGRTTTMAAGPVAALYADEVLDENTCGPCADVNRKWLGNADDAMHLATYPTGGYLGCEGRLRCRGQVVAVWRGGSKWKEWVELPPQR